MDDKINELKKLMDATVLNDEEAMKVDVLKLLEDLERMKKGVSEVRKVVEYLHLLSRRQSKITREIVEAIKNLKE